jgi:hypothetical protein
MARKREVIMDDSDLDSNSDSSGNEQDQIEFDDRDLQDEHSLFDDPYRNKGNKRRRMNDGKADAIYGVFAAKDDQPTKKTNKPDKRLHRCVDLPCTFS